MMLLRCILILACALHGLASLPCTLRLCDQVAAGNDLVGSSCCAERGCSETNADAGSSCDTTLAEVQRPSCVACTVCLAIRGGPSAPTAPSGPKPQLPEFDRVPAAERASLAADIGALVSAPWGLRDGALRGEPASVRRARLCVWVI